MNALVIIAKEPIAGRVKTRLTSEFSPAEAARLAAAALRDTIAVVSAAPATRRVLLFDGDPTGWAPPGWTVLAQCAGSLDVRLSQGLAAVGALGGGPAVLVGMDTPQLRPEQLDFDAGRYDSCLGLAADGGFWAIGFRDPLLAPRAILGVPMSVAETGAAQRDRLHAAGLSVQLLAELADFDTPADARELAVAEPETQFAQAWRAVAGASSGPRR
jgi:glycosyltransferase A (GT-A) superfamily protein (DUF2064 family)